MRFKSDQCCSSLAFLSSHEITDFYLCVFDIFFLSIVGIEKEARSSKRHLTKHQKIIDTFFQVAVCHLLVSVKNTGGCSLRFASLVVNPHYQHVK